MNKQEAFSYYASQLEGIRESGVLKAERIITTPQSAHIFADGKELLNMCANNYLGLADNRELAEAAKAAYDAYGYGLASVRFICGTQSIHKQLEAAVSRFFGTEDTILYSSCFDANGGSQGVGEEIGAAPLAQEVNDFPLAGGKAAGSAAQGLTEGAGDHVHPSHDAAVLRGAPAVLAHKAGGVAVIHHDHGAVLVG